MEEYMTVLRKTELFSGLPDSVLLQNILPYRQVQEYRRGQFLAEPQQKVTRFAVILTGKVHILHLFPEGNYSLMSAMTQSEILAADLICTRSQIAPYHMVAAVSTRVLWLPGELLTKPGMLPEECRQTSLSRLLTLISHENMKKEYRLAILSQKGLRERILTYLSMQSARRNKTTFAISFSREELAAFLCVNRSALSHELSLMQQEGLIRFRKNVFTLCRKAHPERSAQTHRFSIPTE